VSGTAAEAVKKANREHLSTRMTLASLGLDDVANTYVGDDRVRGVSGGQRRRVTVGEMLAARAPVMCGDEISTGLDAASTYEMIQVILHYGRKRKQTNIFALLQPSPETVSLFDEVIVLAEGKIIYAGPIEQVEDYFANIGFKSPPYIDVADFLQMLSTDEGLELYDPPEATRSIRPNPPTVGELASIFRESLQGITIRACLTQPSPYIWKEGDKGSEHGVSIVSDLSRSEAVRKKYANRFPRSTLLILRRFLLLWTRDRRPIIASFVKNVLMGISVGGVFFNTSDPISIQGCLFQAGLFIMLGKTVARNANSTGVRNLSYG
jgi:ABC-2 type transporter